MSSNKWSALKDRIDQMDDSSSLWVKLRDDGDKVVGVFLGDPFPREVHWTGERYAECTGKGCEHCAETKPSLRVVINLAVKTEAGWEVKALEQSATFFKDVLKVDAKYGLANWSFELERHGAKGDSKTSYSILPEDKLTAEDRKALDALEPIDLANLYAQSLAEAAQNRGETATSEAKAGGTANASFDGGNETVPAKVADAVIAVMKELPREFTDRFLAKFKLKRIRDLKLTDKATAIAYLDELEAEHRKAASPSQAEDPFA